MPNPKSKSQQETFEYFFDLPPELREQILSHLLIASTGLHFGDEFRPRETVSVMDEYVEPESANESAASLSEEEEDDDDDDDDEDNTLSGPHSSVPWPFNYFLASLQMYREASAVFFGRNTFHLHATARKSPLVDAESEHGLLANPAFLGSRRRVRRAVLYVRRIGGPLERDVAPPLLDMMLSGALRDLDVRVALLHPGRSKGVAGVVWHLTTLGLGGQIVVPSAAAAAARTRELKAVDSVWDSGPFRCLLRLLSDPDLERARLRVAGACHDALWCGFHAPREDVGGEYGSSGRGIPGCEVLGSIARCPAGREWLDIDLKVLIERYGGSKILKVGD